MKQNIIEVKNLSKEFKGQTALRDITMAIPENCVYGLLGNPYPYPAGAQRWAAVRDYGAGFSDRYLQYAAQEFYSGDASRHDRRHQGLGLASAKRFLEAQGGFLEYRNADEGMGQKWLYGRKNSYL